uniref:Uncharacterized protein n=1 Tax=Parascaris equorum TaxID=6256 RepID=A0A914S0M5_PAREQ
MYQNSLKEQYCAVFNSLRLISKMCEMWELSAKNARMAQ